MGYTILKKVGMLSLFLAWSGLANCQQLPQYSQYLFNGLYINPAYAGYKYDGYIQTTYRNQWTNFPGAPKTVAVTADFSANEGSMGFGISFMDDRIGPTTNTGGLLTYAYRIRPSANSQLSLGLSSGFSRYAIDPSLFVANDPNDPLIQEGKVDVIAPNLNSGLFFHTDNFFAGFSVYNLIGKGVAKKEDVALAYHDFHYFLTMGRLFKISSEVQLKSSFLVKQIKGSPTNYDLNAMFLFHNKFWFGGSYRSNIQVFGNNLQEDLVRRNALAWIIELFATPDLRIGYAYDHNLNVLNSFRNNSHEISVGYYLRAKNIIMKNPRWF
jgi:type IX secretion system PorP/SprF family membrane protein